MAEQIQTPEWRNDSFGEARQALYLGKLYVGCIMQTSERNVRRAGQPWRGWFMSDDEGDETGWFATADEARASVESTLAEALRADVEIIKD